MPQNAIIRADGSGDYTSPIAWEAGEQSSNYGSVTVGRLDGFFDLGSSNLDFNGTWSNGARLECFSSLTGFDGTERSLCGVTSTSSGMTVRGRSTLVQLAGLEIYNTGTGEPYQSTTGTPNFDHEGCLFHNPVVNVCIPVNAASTSQLTNCVTVAKEHSTQVFNHTGCNHFSNTTSDVGANAGSMDDTVVVNVLSGRCIRPSVIQSNNATTDVSGDTLINIVIADNFVSSDPVGDGDYRIKSGSPLDTNGIGSFVEASSGGLTVTGATANFDYSSISGGVDLTAEILVSGATASYSFSAIVGDVDLTASIEVSGQTTGFDYSAISGSIDLTDSIDIVGQVSSFSYSAIDGAVDLTGEVIVTGLTANFNYQTVSGGVELTTSIDVSGSTANYNYNVINGSVALVGDIDITGSTVNYSYTGVKGFVQMGDKTDYSNISVGFAQDQFSVKYKQNTITVNYK